MSRASVSFVVLAAIAVGYNAFPARSALVFQGPRRDHETTIRTTYTALPQRGKQSDILVSEFSGAEWRTAEEVDDPESLGIYDENTHRLLLRGDDHELAVTFAHEFGHHVFYTSFSRSERSAWRRYWKAHRTEMPAGEAREDADEGFAECYAGTFFPGTLAWQVADPIKARMRAFF